MRSAKPTILLSLVLMSLLLLVPSQGVGQELTAKAVKDAIRKGVRFLRGRNVRHPHVGGITGLKALALLNAGVPPNDPEVAKLIRELKDLGRGPTIKNYVVSLRVMVFAAADPTGRGLLKDDIIADVNWLVDNQVTQGRSTGGWSYTALTPGQRAGGADPSNSQFSLLALHEAARIGIKVDQQVWVRAAEYWTKYANGNGGFGYSFGGNSTGSMTCAGISSWIIISENLKTNSGLIENGNVVCCGADANDVPYVDAGIRWVGNNFSTEANPTAGGGKRETLFYYLYALERAGRLSGQRFFGPHDWYRAGTKKLLKTQLRSGAWDGVQSHFGEGIEDIATAFALLFLSKGKRPVVFGKLQHSSNDDWDRHPKGVHQLTKNLEETWRRKLNWQTVRRNATVNDMLEARVLVISGRNQLDLSRQEKLELKKYVENGGFILAEACQGDGCGMGVRFDREFRILMKELFPESELEVLPKDHPIWAAQHAILPDKNFPLLGMQACCRTSVVYCPRTLTARWQVDRKGLRSQLNARSAAQVDWCTKLGENIAAYATGRQLRDKLDIPKTDQGKSVVTLNERVLVLPKLEHGGGSDEAPNAWRNILREAEKTGLRVKLDKKMINADLEQLIDYPFVFMHGRDRFTFSADERKAIKTYVERGGFIFADSICASKPFADSFRSEMEKIFPGSKLERIPANHPLWTNEKFGFKLETVTLRKLESGGGFRDIKIPPKMDGLSVDGRLQVIFSPHDLSCAMENAAASQCEGYLRDDAAIMAIKILYYVLRRSGEE